MASVSRQSVVCVLSSHSLVLRELLNLLSDGTFHLRSLQFDPSISPISEEFSVPRAAVYVIDSDSTRSLNAMIRRVNHQRPESRIVAISDHFSELGAFELLKLGVKALITHQQLQRELSPGVAAVAQGGYWVPRVTLARFVDWLLQNSSHKHLSDKVTGLTRRQTDVLNALLSNLSNKEIAESLNISERTVKFHVSSLLEKFGVRRRADLILVCYQTSSTTPSSPRLPFLVH